MTLCIVGFDDLVTSFVATIATGWSDPCRVGLSPTEKTAPSRGAPCCAHYPGGSSECACRLLPRSCCIPQMAGGSASALTLSRPAQALRVLRPVGLLSHPR